MNTAAMFWGYLPSDVGLSVFGRKSMSKHVILLVTGALLTAGCGSGAARVAAPSDPEHAAPDHAEETSLREGAADQREADERAQVEVEPVSPSSPTSHESHVAHLLAVEGMPGDCYEAIDPFGDPYASLGAMLAPVLDAATRADSGCVDVGGGRLACFTQIEIDRPDGTTYTLLIEHPDGDALEAQDVVCHAMVGDRIQPPWVR